MKTLIFLSLMFTSFILSYAQDKYTVKDLSNDYYGIIYVEIPNKSESPGWVAIYDKNSNNELIKVESENIYLGKLVGIIKELPYEKQSLIIYEDFNFDNVFDFAIQDGHNSCYGGPSYKIYLADKDKFVYNDKFTELAQNYCGMFNVDHEKNIISNTTKSGCCWHEYSEFIVEKNTPKAVLVVTEDATGESGYVVITTKKLENGKWIKTIKKEKIKE